MNTNTKIKLLSALMWLLAAWELLNALGTTVFVELGASLYGFTNYANDGTARIVFQQYGMVLYVLAVGYAIIATDVVKYEQMIWMVVVEQVVGAIISTVELLGTNQVISWSNFTLVHTPQVILVIALWFLRLSADDNTSKGMKTAAVR
jgi:hypothetical protein